MTIESPDGRKGTGRSGNEGKRNEHISLGFYRIRKIGAHRCQRTASLRAAQDRRGLHKTLGKVSGVCGGDQGFPRAYPGGSHHSHRLSACLKCPNKCTLKKRRIVSFKEGETRKEETFYDKAKEGKIVRKTNHQFKPLQLTEEESQWAEWVILRYYPNQKHLRKRNTIVEHPYGTVKRWHGA